MRRRKNAGRAGILRLLTAPLALTAAILLLFTALSNLEAGRWDTGRRQLEDSIRRAAVSCYASEGVYPPAVDYLEAHYGLQIDTERYTVEYQVFAENLMPEITVLENGGELPS